MLSLGLDPSLAEFGWCVFDDQAPPHLRLIESGHEGTISLTVPVARFIHFRQMVRALLEKFSIDVVGIESPAYGGGPFSENHFGLMMFALEAIFEQRKDCVLFDPTTVKFLVGKANFAKSDMQRYVQLDTMSSKVINNNEADAYCIAKLACRFMATRSGALRPEDLSEHERRTFLERTKRSRLTGAQKRVAHVFRENNRFFLFSSVPSGTTALPHKSQIDTNLLKFLEDQHGENEAAPQATSVQQAPRHQKNRQR